MTPPPKRRRPRASAPEPDAVPAFTGTPEALDRFRQALIYASASLQTRAETSPTSAANTMSAHAEWLEWGIGRMNEQPPPGPADGAGD